MWEPVGIALLIHLGKKAIDRFWQSAQAGNQAIVDSSGHLGTTYVDRGRVQVARDFTVRHGEQYELIVGNLYVPFSVSEIMTGAEIVLVLVVEERQQNVLLFAADIEGYAIYLPHGLYSFYVFLMDADEDDLFDALIHAVGLPSGLDLSDVDTIDLEDHDDVWELVDTAPTPVLPGGPYYLDFILIDTLEVPEFPMFFSELFEG